MIFQNRIDAARQLAQRLKNYKNEEGVILAIPRGGVPIAYEIAKELEWPLDLMLTKKLGHPKHKEYAIGAVGLNEKILIPHPDIPESYIESETEAIRSRLTQMRQKFMGDKQPENVKGKTVILIDDGIATGNTILASVEILRKQHPAKIIVAVPVASYSAVRKLSSKADEVIVLSIPEEFYGVGQFYFDFTQVSDEEVMTDLKKVQSRD
jgi:putative phosphoribosyl transferase